MFKEDTRETLFFWNETPMIRFSQFTSLYLEMKLPNLFKEDMSDNSSTSKHLRFDLVNLQVFI